MGQTSDSRLSGKSGAGLSVSYGYDGGLFGLGRRTSMADSAGTASYSYDPRGRLTSVVRTINGSSYTLGTTYDEQDRVLTQTYPNGDALAYRYGDDGRPVSLTLNGTTPLVSGASYNALGQPTSLPLGNGLVTQYRYYALDQAPPQPNQWYGRLYSIATGGVQSQTITSYDAVGNPTGINYSDHTAESFAASYNEWDQLTSYGSVAGYTYLAGSPGYDIGTLQTKGADTFTYPAPGQPIPHAPSNVGPSGGPYGYDANGNRDGNSTYVYRYDAENHLLEVDDLGLPQIQNTYDGDGTRLVRTLTGGSTQYVGAWYEVDPATGVGTAYYPFNGRPVAVKRGAALSYLHHDHLGSLVSATDAGGNELGWARYLPFGGLRLSGGTLPSDRLFTGQTRDFGDAFYFFKSRYYDATLGQFQSPDMALPKLAQGPGSPQTLNRYAYARNNPLRLVDPSGHAAALPDEGGPPLSFAQWVHDVGLVPNDQTVMINAAGQVDGPNAMLSYRPQFCTLVDAATVLQFYGASGNPAQLTTAIARQLGWLAMPITSGPIAHLPDGVRNLAFPVGPTPYNEDYVWPLGQSKLDASIEAAARSLGLANVHSHTQLLLTNNDTVTLLGALKANQPVILNQVYAGSSGEPSHSVIGYGLVHQGLSLYVQIADPDWTVSNTPNAPYDLSRSTYLESWQDVLLTTVSATYISRGG